MLPNYYSMNKKQYDETGLEKSLDLIDMESERSILSHIFDLFKIQIYFLLRLNKYKTFDNLLPYAEKLSEIT